jgi:16S rRNA (uracil1498-N3)-methyltransferase
MPATPAWPLKSLPRLFVRQLLGEGAHVELDAAQANYLGNVLRLGAGAELLLFDGSSGEWLARIAEIGKKRMTLIVEWCTRKAETIPDVWLAFAPVKRAQTDWLVEKATELGAARLMPVMTQRTVAERVKRRSNAGARGCRRLPSRFSSRNCSTPAMPAALCTSPTRPAVRPPRQRSR